MVPDIPAYSCPDCDGPLAYAFHDTSGVGAWKQGDGFNTTPDTAHYLCFLCLKAWKQRLSGPLTADVVGDLAFFTCGVTECGNRLEVTRESNTPAGIELTCREGHAFAVRALDGEGLVLEIIHR